MSKTPLAYSLAALLPCLALAKDAERIPASAPALSPEDAQKRFVVPDGFEVRLFASEPMVQNPVAMSWDERGRLWVVELFEYPRGAAPDAKGRDQVKILEDTDGDGAADKMVVFADGLDLASGILCGNGGAYVGQQPHLLFLKDTDGDDMADQYTVELTGFGREDTHELLNSFTWGPDGCLYMTHGVFTHSKVRDPRNPDDPGVVANAAVARFDPRTRKFEVFADGTSNPWGVDFDWRGNAFLSACVIDHMFHMHPGGHYARQGGSPDNPFGYELLPSIVDHAHFRAAYAGVQIYNGGVYPDDYTGKIFIGNIHGNMVHMDELTPSGGTFVSSHVNEFLTTDDGWFRPVSTQTGPDGNLWVMDWYDKYPCYQNAQADPEGVDREYGRIWRVVYTGGEAGKPVPAREKDLDLAKLGAGELVALLEHGNNWMRKMARRQLAERFYGDAAAKMALAALFQKADAKPEHRLEALWALHGAGVLDKAALDAAAASEDPAFRIWAARLTGERREAEADSLNRLVKLGGDADITVRLAAATACRQFASGNLTVNRPPPGDAGSLDLRPVLGAIFDASKGDEDKTLRFLTWMAVEPKLAADPAAWLGWLSEAAPRSAPFSLPIIWKAARRISDLRNPEHMALAARFAEDLLAEHPAAAAHALDGLLKGQEQGGSVPPKGGAADLFAKLAAHDDANLRGLGRRLGVLWGDEASIKAVVAEVNDAALSDGERIEALKVVRKLRAPEALNGVVQLAKEARGEALQIEAIRALAEMGPEDGAQAILARWKEFGIGARLAAADALTSRGPWIEAFFKAVEAGEIAAADIPVPVIRALATHKNENIRKRAEATIGTYRDPGKDFAKLVNEKRAVVLSGEPNLENGRALLAGTCLICHQFHGEGVEVGPDLTGSGRSNLNALLSNVLNPNQIIGRGYNNAIVETSDGRTIAGRIVEDTDTAVVLLGAGGVRTAVPAGEVKSKTVTENSLMPEGFSALPDDAIRDLVWYLLNPPQDNRPMTDALRAELVGDDLPVAGEPEKRESIGKVTYSHDEALALWNPDWRVIAPIFEGSPRIIPDWHERKNVMEVHPVDRNTPAAFERFVNLPKGAKVTLKVSVAAHDHPEADWELRVTAGGQLAGSKVINKEGGSWQRRSSTSAISPKASASSSASNPTPTIGCTNSPTGIPSN
ncbi:MAG: hypothetical protein R3F11_13480 [Verrucomicrobiales bacterium]